MRQAELGRTSKIGKCDDCISQPFSCHFTAAEKTGCRAAPTMGSVITCSRASVCVLSISGHNEMFPTKAAAAENVLGALTMKSHRDSSTKLSNQCPPAFTEPLAK